MVCPMEDGARCLGGAACPYALSCAAAHLCSLPIARPTAEVYALAHHAEVRLCCSHCTPLSAALFTCTLVKEHCGMHIDRLTALRHISCPTPSQSHFLQTADAKLSPYQ